MEIPIERFEKDGLLKVLLSTKCRFDCKYCPNAWRRGTSVETKKLAEFIRAKGIRSVFISSSVFRDSDDVMDRIIEAGELVRDFVDYLHLKIMPYSDKDQIKRAIEVADRVSLNFESPRKDILSEVSSLKNFKEFLRQERTISKLVKKAGKSHTTQIIIGLGETDYDALKFAEVMYKKFGAKRVYYSPFTPVKGTPMENERAERVERMKRLYRADALIRLYGYSVKDMKEIMIDGLLPKDDPKILLAEKFGILDFISLPGIGLKAAKMLEKGFTLADLKRMGFRVGKASGYISAQTKLSEFF